MVINSNSSSTPARLRKTHRGKILSRIQAEPGISRADLARMCGFSEMAATRIVRELLSAGIIEESNTPDKARQKHVGRQFCREIQQIIDLPVEIENLCNALAIAEMRFGMARDVADFTLIHVATFVGAGIVSENKLVRGDAVVSGLMGHFRSEKRPLICTCGRRDCLHLSATGFGLLSRMGKLDHQTFDTSQLSYYAASLLAALKDENAAKFVAETGANVPPAIDVVANLLRPEMIILSGYLGSSDCYFDAAQKALIDHFDYDPRHSFTLLKGTISSVAAAALLALHSFCYSDRLDYDRFARFADQSQESNHG